MPLRKSAAAIRFLPASCNSTNSNSSSPQETYRCLPSTLTAPIEKIVLPCDENL